MHVYLRGENNKIYYQIYKTVSFPFIIGPSQNSTRINIKFQKFKKFKSFNFAYKIQKNLNNLSNNYIFWFIKQWHASVALQSLLLINVFSFSLQQNLLQFQITFSSNQYLIICIFSNIIIYFVLAISQIWLLFVASCDLVFFS